MTTVKEAVDNALDACEEAGILPELRVEVFDKGRFAYAPLKIILFLFANEAHRQGNRRSHFFRCSGTGCHRIFYFRYDLY